MHYTYPFLHPPGHIGRTLEKKEKPVSKQDPFSTDLRKPPADTKSILGINPKHERYALSKWCYDTPGTVQPEQVSITTCVFSAVHHTYVGHLNQEIICWTREV